MVERGLGGTDINAAVVHVWTVGGSSCPSCSGDEVTLNVPFPAGKTCECTAKVSITLGSGVVIPRDATVTFIAPLVTIQPGVAIENGSVVHIRQPDSQIVSQRDIKPHSNSQTQTLEKPMKPR